MTQRAVTEAEMHQALDELVDKMKQMNAETQTLKQALIKAEDRVRDAETMADRAAQRAQGSHDAAVNAIAAAQNANAIAMGMPGGGAAAAAALRKKEPKVFPISFSGGKDDDWIVFKHNFKVHARLQPLLTDDEKKFLLQASLKGEASRVMMWEEHEGPVTFEQMLNIYEAKFLPPSASDEAKVKYENTRQLPKEDLVHYSSRLLANFQRAYPDQKEIQNLVDGPLTRMFIRGLQSRKEAEHVMRTSPHNLDSALAAAQKEHAVQSGSFQHFHPGGGRGGAEAMDCSAIQWNDDELRIAALNGGPPRCYFCNLFGHTRADCPSYKKHLASGGKPQRGIGTGGAGTGRRFINNRGGGGAGAGDKRPRPPGQKPPGGRPDYRAKRMNAMMEKMDGILDEYEQYLKEEPEDEDQPQEERDEEDAPVKIEIKQEDFSS